MDHYYDEETGGYSSLCVRCGTARGVVGGYCASCEDEMEDAYDEDGNYVYDDHTERMAERRQMGLGNF